MRSLENRVAWQRIAGLILALALVAGCNKDVASPVVGDPGPTHTVDVAFCTGLEPRWVAFQDGDGTWVQAQPFIRGPQTVYRHIFSSNHAAIAKASTFGSGLTSLDVQYGSPEELAIVADTTPSHCGTPVSRTILGTIAGLDTNDIAIVSAGAFSRAFVVPDAQHSFVLSGLPDGPQDILATRDTRVNNAEVLTKMIIRRTPPLADSTTIDVLDFDSAEAFAPVVANVTVLGQGPEGVITHTTLRTANSESLISFHSTNVTAAVHGYDAVPESKLAATDLQILTATVAPSSNPIDAVRTASIYFRTPTNQTIAIGSALVPPSISTLATSPYLRLRAVFVAQPDYDRNTVITFQQGDNTLVTIAMTGTYADITSRGYDLAIPDLSRVPGFDPSWALRAGANVLWNVSRTGGTLGLGPDAVPTNGSTQRYAVSLFTLMTP